MPYARLDNYEWVKSVLESGAIVRIKTRYGIDTIKFSWVEPYIEELNCRKRIEQIGKEILEVQARPIHRKEMREKIKQDLLQQRQEAICYLKERAGMVQRRVIENCLGTVQRLDVNTFKGLEPNKLIGLFLDLSDKDIDNICKDLQDGVSSGDISIDVSRLENERNRLEKAIRDYETKDHSRWIYTPSGSPVRYPKGCRWSIYVEDWRKVASRFAGDVDIEGFSITSSDELSAYRKLGIDKVLKRTPLRQPRIIPPKSWPPKF